MEPNLLERVKSGLGSLSSKSSGGLDASHFIAVPKLDGRRRGQKLKTEEFFHKHVFEQRIRITAETFLMEANHRAKLAGKKAYVHVVGLGLGVWKLLSTQPVRELTFLLSDQRN